MVGRARLRERKGGLLFRSRGAIVPIGGGSVEPTGAITVRIGTLPPLTVSVKRQGAANAGSGSVYRYRGTGEGIRRLRLESRFRRFSLWTGPLATDLVFAAAAGPGGCRGQVPVQLEIPTADGVLVFRTTVEPIRRAGADQLWKRPRRPCD